MSRSENELYCPLCLKVLNAREELIIFRSAVRSDNAAEPRSITINCGDSIVEEISRFAGHEVNVVAKIDEMVFVSHVNCEAENLFWEKDVQVETAPDPTIAPQNFSDPDNEEEDIEEEHNPLFVRETSFDNRSKASAKDANRSKTSTKDMVVIPGAGSYLGSRCELDFICDKTLKNIVITVNHPIIRMLRKTSVYYNDHPNMWFPYPLLHTAGKGNFVELIGSKEVGKTILSLQLSQTHSYASTPEKPFGIWVNDYFYLREKGSFKRELAIRTEWKSNPYSRPIGSAATPGDVRALFVKPADKSRMAKSNATRRSRKKRAFLRSVIESIRHTIGIFSSGGNSSGETAIEPDTDGNKKVLFENYLEDEFYPVIFYDTAGEEQNKNPEEMRDVRFYSNRKAILIDAQEIFDNGAIDSESIQIAYERLAELYAPGGMAKDEKVCLVITKLDLVRDKYNVNEVRKIIETFPATLEEEEQLDNKTRNLLRKWLNVEDDDKKNLREFLKSKDLIDRVYFIWTENLPKMAGIRLSPIRDFQKTSGKAGDVVTINAEPDYFDNKFDSGNGFDLVEKVSFAGKKAEIISRTPQVIKVKVPEEAKTGFIEIELRDSNDTDLTSKQIFRVLGDVRTCKPKSYGLAQFLAWCLDVRVTEIINFEEEEEEEEEEQELEALGYR